MTTPIRIGGEGLALVKRWEGLRTAAYRDSAGIWTIGYGHTAGVQAGQVVTEPEANAMLLRDLAEAESAVVRLVAVDLSQSQFDALVSLVFNIGVRQFQNSTLLRLLNDGKYDAVPAQFLRWNQAGGKVVKGLANRRAAEAGLWSRGSFVASRDVRPDAPTSSVLATDTARGAGAVGAAGVVAVAVQAAPAVQALGGLPVWTAIAVILAAMLAVLLWRWRRA